MTYLDTIKEKKTALQDKDQLTRSMQELVRLLSVSNAQAPKDFTAKVDQFGTASGLGAGWDSYTPTLSGRFNNAKWTKNCKYKQVGKMVTVKIGLTANAATPMDGGTADCFITLPVTAAALTQTGNIQVMGMFNGFISGLHIGNFSLASTTTAILRTQAVSGSNVIQQQITSTVPATWASGNEIGGTFTYEAA